MFSLLYLENEEKEYSVFTVNSIFFNESLEFSSRNERKKKKEGEGVWNADLAVQIRLRRVKGKGSCSDQVPFPSKSIVLNVKKD